MGVGSIVEIFGSDDGFALFFKKWAVSSSGTKLKIR